MEQSAFVPGQQITDNIMVTFEAMHVISRNKNGSTGLMAVKLDMSKAYNWMEWSFL